MLRRMHPTERPSRAAIAALTSPKLMADWLTSGLRKQGYRRFDRPLPSWHRPHAEEWLGYVITRSDDLRLAVAIPEHQGLAFQTAMWLSEDRPGSQLVAYRYQRGLDRCLKYYAGGKPQYKRGEDPDLEVAWNVPQTPAFDIVTADEAGLPGTPDGFVETLGAALLLSYQEQVQRHGPEDLVVSFLHRDSPLWD